MKLFDINGNQVNIETSSNANNVTIGEKLIDTSVIVNTGYSGELQTQYGSNVNIYGDFIDVSVEKKLYYKVPIYNKSSTKLIGFGCYDENKNFLYKSSDVNTISNVSITSNYDINGIGTDNGNTLYSISYNVLELPEEVKYVKVAQSNNDKALFTSDLFAIGRTPFVDLWDTWEDYVSTVSDDFKKEVNKIHATSNVGVFIGDSLTNWGGGNDESGFLKIVHDKTGIITKNEGLAGAWWQMGSGQTACGVQRVDTLISEGRKYDLYCFLLGTNNGSPTDTGETSADTSTMCGAIRYCLEKLKEYDPTSKILVCLPPQRAEGNENQEKVNEVIKSIANSYSVKTLDVYHESGIVPNTKIANTNYLSDGLHLNENGKQMLGDLLASEIKYLLCI